MARSNDKAAHIFESANDGAGPDIATEIDNSDFDALMRARDAKTAAEAQLHLSDRRGQAPRSHVASHRRSAGRVPAGSPREVRRSLSRCHRPAEAPLRQVSRHSSFRSSFLPTTLYPWR